MNLLVSKKLHTPNASRKRWPSGAWASHVAKAMKIPSSTWWPAASKRQGEVAARGQGNQEILCFFFSVFGHLLILGEVHMFLWWKVGIWSTWRLKQENTDLSSTGWDFAHSNDEKNAYDRGIRRKSWGGNLDPKWDVPKIAAFRDNGFRSPWIQKAVHHITFPAERAETMKQALSWQFFELILKERLSHEVILAKSFCVCFLIHTYVTQL